MTGPGGEKAGEQKRYHGLSIIKTFVSIKY